MRYIGVTKWATGREVKESVRMGTVGEKMRDEGT